MDLDQWRADTIWILEVPFDPHWSGSALSCRNPHVCIVQVLTLELNHNPTQALEQVYHWCETVWIDRQNWQDDQGRERG